MMRWLTWKDKTILYIVLAVAISIFFMHELSAIYNIDIGNILTIISFLFLAISAILLYFQVQSGLVFNTRKQHLIL
jgi:hypothetical protein